MLSFGSTEGNIKGRKKINKQLKIADCEPYVTPPAEKQHRRLHTALASGGWAGRRGVGCIARIWPEYPERYLSEIVWASKPDCGISTTQRQP